MAQGPKPALLMAVLCLIACGGGSGDSRTSPTGSGVTSSPVVTPAPTPAPTPPPTPEPTPAPTPKPKPSLTVTITSASGDNCTIMVTAEPKLAFLGACSVTKVKFTASKGGTTVDLGTKTSKPYTVSKNVGTGGTWKVKAEASDSCGQQDSASKNVDVKGC